MKPIHILSVCILVVTLLLSAPLAQAAFVPATLSYQGSLYTTDGSPFNGVKDITFKLYTIDTGGTAFWSEVQSSVHITNGRFATVLGSGGTLNPASFSADVWLGVQVAGETGEMTPRQKMTSVAFAFNAVNASNGVPVGGIIMWSGSIATIPVGWQLCDGTNNTPNLKNRFVIGADTTGTYVKGATGGEATHVLTINEMPVHNHAVLGYGMLRSDGLGTTTDTNDSAVEPNIVSAVVNPAFNGSGAAHNNMPPYFALAYIMRMQ